jgi:hypothetical protein
LATVAASAWRVAGRIAAGGNFGHDGTGANVELGSEISHCGGKQMSDRGPHRKRVKHYHDPGDLHELTFSCYRRLKLLTSDAWRTNLARSIDAAMLAWSMQLVAFVFMPEHVHLLVLPLTGGAGRVLAGMPRTNETPIRSCQSCTVCRRNSSRHPPSTHEPPQGSFLRPLLLRTRLAKP